MGFNNGNSSFGFGGGSTSGGGGGGLTQVTTTNTCTFSFYGQGTSGSPLCGCPTLSSFSNQGIVAFNDGLWSPNPIRNGLIYGGVVTWLQNYDYSVSAAGYYINGIFYTSPLTTVTLAPADPTLDRIDLFVLTTSGTATSVTGTPANPPQAPTIDPNTQLDISFAFVSAGSTNPGITSQYIYFNNAEWTATASTPTINVASTNSPYSPPFDVEATLSPVLSRVSFTTTPFAILPTYSSLIFYIKSKATWPTNRRLLIRWLSGGSGGTVQGTTVNLDRNSVTYGFDSSQTATYQRISIPLSDFGLTSSNTIDTLSFTTSGGSVLQTNGFFLDNIEIQSGNPSPDPALNLYVPSLGCCSTIRCNVNNVAVSSFSSALSGRCNLVNTSSSYSSILSGFNNQITTSSCAVNLGGTGNFMTNSSGSLSGVGNQLTTTNSTYSVNLSGSLNTLCGNCSAILSGAANCVRTPTSVVLAGVCNRIICGEYSNILGGFCNYIESTLPDGCNVISGGACNTICSGVRSTISGGYRNFINSSRSVIGGGGINTITCDLVGCIPQGAAILGGVCNCVSKGCSFIGGGQCNFNRSVVSAITGGRRNATTTSACYSFIGAGRDNQVSGCLSSLSGGEFNVASANHSVIGAGVFNTSSGNCSGVLSGRCNVSSSTFALVTGGEGNLAQGVLSFVGGGECNNVRNGTSSCLALGSVVVGGVGNNTTGGTWNLATCSFTVAPTIIDTNLYTFIGGGFQNRAIEIAAAVLGGCCNLACGNLSSVSGGFCNSVTGSRSSILGGSSNTVSGFYSALGSGVQNTLSGFRSFLGSGTFNVVSSTAGFIGTGATNTVSACYSFIGNGRNLTTSGNYSFIGNGTGSTVQAEFSFIGSGIRNCICHLSSGCCALGSVIVGGVGNNSCGGTWDLATCSFTVAPTYCNTSRYSFIGGGFQNLLTGTSVGNTAIVGGCCNSTLGDFAFIGGGGSNAVSNFASVNVGGVCNVVSNQYSFNGGGQQNTLSGLRSFNGGGIFNTNSGNYSVSVGGRSNSTIGDLSFTGGGCNHITQGYSSIVVGGIRNNVCNTNGCLALGSVVVGGVGNNTTGGTWDLATCSFTVLPTICSTGQYTFIGGGFQNRVEDCNSVAVGGFNNRALGLNSAILGGCSNCIIASVTGNSSVIVGGFRNCVSCSSSFIGGGQDNSISQSFGSITGGTCNLITSASAFVGGGTCNCVTGGCGVVVGGIKNCATACLSATLSGYLNTSNGYSSVTLNGCKNLTQGDYGFIGNGVCNNVCNVTSGCLALGSVIVGGIGNNTTGGTWDLATCSFTVAPTTTDSGRYSFIGGGFQNQVLSDDSVVVGGKNNIVGAQQSAIVGGFGNCANGITSFVGAGRGNHAHGLRSSIVAGCDNDNNAIEGFIGAGNCNHTFNATNGCLSYAAVVVGGVGNNTTGGTFNLSSCSFTGGGPTICNAGQFSFVGAGFQNKATGSYSVSVGGCNNTSSGAYSVTLGGENNTASNTYSAVLSGCSNTANGIRSTILGGQLNNTCSFADAHIIGSNINATQVCTTFVNCLSAGNLTTGCFVCVASNGVISNVAPPVVYSLAMGYFSTDLAASTTYYTGVYFQTTACTTPVPSRRIIVPRSGFVKAIGQMTNVTGTKSSATPNVTMRIRNVTTATNCDYASDSFFSSGGLTSCGRQDLYTFTGNGLSVTAGDLLEIQIITPAWVTAPIGVFQNFSVYINNL